MENLNEALGGALLVTGLVIIIYIISRYTYLVKKAMIEKGFVTKKTTTNTLMIDIACIGLGLGLGLLLSSIYTLMNLTEDTADLLIWGTIVIFASLGLLTAQIVRKRFEQ